MKNTLVTAIYYTTPTSRIGGRGYTFEFYEAPFRNILNLGCNIVIYSHESEISKIHNFFSRYNFTDYKVIEYDLHNYNNSDKIYHLKEQDGIINSDGLIPGEPYFRNDRNHHLCLSKPYFLKDTIDNQYFESENYYWIDAGLFHHGIIPEKFGGIERLTRVNEENYWPNNPNNICNTDMISKLQSKNNTDLIFIGLHEFPMLINWSKFFDFIKQVHIIGGFFGGKKDIVLELYQDFVDLSNDILNNDILTLEEEVLSMLYTKKYNIYEHIPFLSWYHDVPESPNYYEPSPHPRFYKIFI